MTTQIELKFPYNKWRKGYLVTSKDGRKTLILYNSNKDRTSVSYARYLMSVHLNRLLTKEEHVDHIDDDKTNDVITNLQLLSPTQNNQKSAKQMTYVTLICGFCHKSFDREIRQMHKKLKLKPCCSRYCSRKLQFISS